MDYGSLAERLMGMDDRVWMRHANPWSGWTRVAMFPLLFIAIWSHVWIGWWSLVPVGVLAVWTWLNPRVFPPPRRRDAWITRGVFGERVWLNRRNVPIPPHHARAAHILSALSVVGVAVAIYGFIARDFWAAVMGWSFAALAKFWFVDRMVWLFEDMKDRRPEYAAWAGGEDAEQGNAE